MARTPDEELERIKREVKVEDLARARGVVLVAHGADLHGLCVFHPDREPSLVITPAKNLWHCLGACQAGGSVVAWVMRAEAVSFRHAVELLREGYTGAGAEAPVKRSTTPKLESPFDAEAEDAELLGQVARFYGERLRASAEALGYLERRGLRSEEAIERFGLGYSDRTLGYRLPEKNRAAGALIRGRLQALGVLRESGHELFSGSVVFPILDEAGAVVGIYGRKTGEALRAGTARHLYLPGPHRGCGTGRRFATIAR